MSIDIVNILASRDVDHSDVDQEEEEPIPEIVYGDISYAPSVYCEKGKSHLSNGTTWSAINSLSYYEFVRWYEGPMAIIDGALVDQTVSVSWIKGCWNNSDVAQYVYRMRKGPLVSYDPVIPSALSDIIPLSSTHTRDYLDVSSYSSMESYKINTQSHVPLAADVVSQIIGPITAPADGWGLIKSLNSDAIAGDLFGTGDVLRETIGETIARGSPSSTIILAYAHTFAEKADVIAMEKRRGPVVFIDEWPILIERPDLRNIGPNVTSYGTDIVQHVSDQDNAKIRSRLSYDFNLAAVNEGYHWHDWGPFTYYLCRFRTDLTHSASRPYIEDAFTLLSVKSPIKRRKAAVNYLSTYVDIQDCYFCPIGRHQAAVERAYGRTNWLFSRTVYYSDDPLYQYIPSECGHFFVSRESRLSASVDDYGGISFLPRHFKIRYDGKVFREVESGFQMCSASERSQVDFLHQYMPIFDADLASYLRKQRFKKRVINALMNEKLYSFLVTESIDSRVDTAAPFELDIADHIYDLIGHSVIDYPTLASKLDLKYKAVFSSVMSILRSDPRFERTKIGSKYKWKRRY